MEITHERLKQLEDAELKLNALEAGGVDNWQYYGEALEEYSRNKDREIKIEGIFDTICQMLSENIEEPAGRGCGYGFLEKGIDSAFQVLRNGINSL